MTAADAPVRIEAHLKVTGAARYAAEAEIDATLHAALVAAPIPAGEVVAIDSKAARALAGVVDVVTHENAPRIARPGFLNLLQEPAVHFAGQPVALVIASSASIARLAASRVDVQYRAQPAVTAMRQRLDDAFAPKSAGRTDTDSRRGDAVSALADADVVIDARYTTPANNHHPIEPHAVIASWDGDHVTVHTASQAVFAHRKAIADCFGIPAGNVRVVSRYLGGGFGSKGGAWFPCLILAIAAARGRAQPLVLELTRDQMFTLVGRRQETIQRLRIGASQAGKLTALIHESTAQTSVFADYADPLGTVTRMLYACPNVSVSHRLVRVNAPLPCPMRAPGEGPGSFALECGLDELAHAVDVDPLELRLRNFAEHDQHAKLPWSSNGLKECYRIAAERFGWARRPREARRWRDGAWRVGWGMASACYPSYRMAAEAKVRVHADGRIDVLCGTQDMGSGTYTALAQLAAATLGVPVARVSVELGDTDLPEGPYSAGSMATASFTPAVEEAARQLREQLLDIALSHRDSFLLGARRDTLVFDERGLGPDGCDTRLALAQIVTWSGHETLEAAARADPEATPPCSTYGYGAVFAEVRVDPALGIVRVSRLTAAYAAGRILNARLARSQYIGGLIGGIGMALHESTIMDEALGRIVNTNLSDYLVPVHADMPVFDVQLVEEHEPYLPGGAKGIGMLGTVGTAAAIANAVFHATGRRIRRLPLRIEDVLETGQTPS